MMDFLRTPLNLKNVFEKKSMDRCSLEDSIHNHIKVILTSKFKEYRYDINFGSSFWQQDYDNVIAKNNWKDYTSGSLEQSISTYEKRLDKVRVTVDAANLNIANKEDNFFRAKRKITLLIRARIIQTLEPFEHKEIILLSPISIL